LPFLKRADRPVQSFRPKSTTPIPPDSLTPFSRSANSWDFDFAPRIRNVGDSRLFTVEKPGIYPTLAPLVGGSVNSKQILTHWEEILRLATSIEYRTVTASLMLRKLGAYPR
jgi:hypothetical protein